MLPWQPVASKLHPICQSLCQCWRWLLPDPQGLIDAHVHLLGGGQALSWVDLSRVDSKEAFTAAVKTAAGQRSFMHSIASQK